jgi:hypothetical protein
MGSAAGNAGSGAGGLRFSACTWCAPAPVSPLAATAIPVTAQGYPISVGGGGAGKPTSEPSPTRTGNNGSNSSGLGITSTGGGGGGKYQVQGNSGGSGGGTGADLTPVTGGSGNTPPVSPPQGNPGGDGLPCGASDYPTEAEMVVLVYKLISMVIIIIGLVVEAVARLLTQQHQVMVV